MIEGTEFIICGKCERGDALVYVCGAKRENAERLLDRILNAPTENDLRVTKGLSDFYIEEIPSKDAWWNYGTD